MKQKLICLFSIMLMCILGTNYALADGSTLYTWDFSGGAYNGQGGQGGQYTFASAEDASVLLSVDAPGEGKFLGRNGDVQVNATAVISVPVRSAGDVITITNFSSDGNQYNMTYSIGSETGINLQTKAYTVSKSEATTGYVSITVTANGYAKKITVLQHDEDVVPATFEDFKIDFQTNPYTVMLPEGGELPSCVTVNSGTYNGAQHGVENPTITVVVDGPVKFTIGSCQYGSHTVTVTNSNSETLATIDNNNGCDNANQKTKYVTYIYNSETATTLTFTVNGFLPFFYAEATTLIEQCDVTYYDVDGTTVLKTETVDGNSNLAYNSEATAAVTVASGYAFRGWFDGTGASAKKVAEGTAINSDISLYAKATEIEVAEGGKDFEYDLTKDYFYVEDHELFSATNGAYYNNHGWKFASGGSFSVGVAGRAQVILTLCEYSSEGTITVTNSNSEEVGTIASSKAASDGNTATFNYNGDATTLTFSFSSQTYLHGVTVKNIDTSLNSYDVTFKNGDTTVDTYIVYEGMSIGALPSAPSVSSDQQFIGWYTATDGTGTKVTADVVPTEDVTYYANIIDITTTNGYVVVDNSSNDRRSGENLLAALMYANANSTQSNPVKIFLPNGTYDFGTECLTTISGSYISIIGESMDGVVIKNRPVKEGIAITATLLNTGSNNYLQNLTLDCLALYGTGDDTTTAERGVSLQDKGTQTICKNVFLKGLQDTYYHNNNNGVYYFEDSKIEGTVDFICGNGDVYFNNVLLNVVARSTGASSANVICAPNTPKSFGYVFNNTTIDGISEQNNRYRLGRPWASNTIIRMLNTKMNILPIAAGWDEWSSNVEKQNSVIQFAEYNSVDKDGNTVDLSSRKTSFKGVANNPVITESEAANYTPSAVLGDFYDAAKSKIATYSNDVTIGSTGFATIGFPYATTIPEGVTAYAVTGLNGTVLTTTKIAAGTNVAANTGLIISGTHDVTYTFAARPDGTAYADNILVATGSEEVTGSTAGEFYFLTITDTANKKVGWKLNNANRVLRANTAYIPKTSVPNDISVLSFTLDDATAIDGVAEQSEAANGNAYNTVGQRVNANAKGVVIVNGNKVVNQ